jgi:hypothetical protein
MDTFDDILGRERKFPPVKEMLEEIYGREGIIFQFVECNGIYYIIDEQLKKHIVHRSI